MLKITCKLPLSEELVAALRSLPDADAGAAFKAALVYMAGGECPALPAPAQEAFEAMRRLIDLSRVRAVAGRAGGNPAHFAGSKRTFAGSKTDFAGSKQDFAPSKPPKPLQPPEGFDVLAGLGAFLS